VAYDRNNVFARILRGEIPCRKVHEDEHVLAFHDINPAAPVHILVVPKGEYVSFDDFSAKASDAEIAAFTRALGAIARQQGVADTGYPSSPTMAGMPTRKSPIFTRISSAAATSDE
jgi:diadenosine tetraphosphate (Ap4A) HIT family hydrolase